MNECKSHSTGSGMKKIISFLIIYVCSSGALFAQVLISSNLRQDGKFNKATRVYDSTVRDRKETSYFEFDKDFTVCRHITPSKTSLYFIRSAKKDELNNRWEFDVLSNAGYSYYMILDILNNNIRFIYKDNGSTHVTQFAINEFWADK